MFSLPIRLSICEYYGFHNRRESIPADTEAVEKISCRIKSLYVALDTDAACSAESELSPKREFRDLLLWLSESRQLGELFETFWRLSTAFLISSLNGGRKPL